MITVVDYGMGNLASVTKALARLGYPSEISNNPECVKNAGKLILPGVGAFGSAIQNLEKLSLLEPIREFCHSGKPFLGICLGLQLLMTDSQEMGRWQGLGVISGKVVRFYEKSSVPEGLKIPHMGWNSLEIKNYSGIFRDTKPGTSVYFVHSYYVKPDNPDCIAAESTHGETFCASIQYENIYATQFHPEKSGYAGLAMLNRFCEI